MSDFPSIVERFLARHKMPPSVFGQLAMRDSGFVSGLRAGRCPRIDTVGRVEEFMRAYRRFADRPKRAPRSKAPAGSVGGAPASADASPR